MDVSLGHVHVEINLHNGQIGGDGDYTNQWTKLEEVYLQEVTRMELEAAGAVIHETIENGEVCWVAEGGGY